MGRLADWAAALAERSFRSPRLVFSVWLVLALGFAPGIAKLQVDTSTDSVLDKSSEAWSDYVRSRDLFGEDEAVVVAVSTSGDRVGSGDLVHVAALTEALRRNPGFRRVDSISTMPLIRRGPKGSVQLDPAVNRSGGAAVELGELTELLRSDPVAPRLLVSPKMDVLAINAFVRDSSKGYGPLVAEVRHTVGAGRAWVSGVPVFRADANYRTVAELMKFVPLTAVLLAIVLFWGYRSASALVTSALVASAGVVILLGSMGYAAVPLTLTTTILPTIIVSLGCAYSMHPLSAVALAEAEGRDRAVAIGHVARPLLISGLTTAAGLLATCVVRIEAIRFVGGFGALSVAGVTMAALTLGPAGIRTFGSEGWGRGGAARLAKRPADWLVGTVWPRPGLVLASWCVIAVAAGVGAAFLRVDTDVTRWFRSGTVTRDDYVAIRKALAGITQINVLLEPKDGESITRAASLRKMAGLQRFLEDQEVVGKTLSYVDAVLAVHRAIGGGGLDELSDEMIDQYLLMLDSMEALRDLLTEDHQAASVALRLNDNGSEAILDLADDINKWWSEQGDRRIEATVTGVMYQFARAADEIAWGQARGLLIAVCVVALLLWAYFGSVGTALVAMIPNVIPLLVCFGAMGALGIPLDAGTILIGNLAIGIGVDDTVHLLEAFADRGSVSLEEGVRTAFGRVLPAVVMTTVAVGLGLLVLGISGFTFVRTLGLVTAGVLVVCLGTDLTLLPAVLRVLEARGQSGVGDGRVGVCAERAGPRL